MDTATVDAVDRWQVDEGYPATGQIALGQVVFLPSAVLVGAENVAPGQAAAPGDVPYVATTTERTVTVPLNPNLPTVDRRRTRHDRPADECHHDRQGHGRGPGPVERDVWRKRDLERKRLGPVSGVGGTEVTPDIPPPRERVRGRGPGVAHHPIVSGVLAAPVSALLALSGGGYGLEVVGTFGDPPLRGRHDRHLRRQKGPGERAGNRSGHEGGRWPSERPRAARRDQGTCRDALRSSHFGR